MSGFKVHRGRPISATPITLADLTISPANAVPGSGWSATISGAAIGSTVTATSSDSTVLSVVGAGSTRTVSGTFSSAGTPNVTPSEALAGATNTPHASPATAVTVATNPWPAGATVVHNATELTNAIRNGADGTHYLCAPGDYGAYDPGFAPRSGRPPGSAPVHVWGQAGVTFTSFGINSGQFVHVHYITANGAQFYGFSAGSSTDIAFDHCLATNALQKGFNMQNSTNCALTWCKSDNCPLGVAWVNCTGITMTDCWVDNFTLDAFDVFGNTGGTVARCLTRNPAPGDNHPDAFQCSSYQGVRNTDITLTDINFDRNGGSQTNGPVFSDGGDRLTWTNVAAFGCNNNGVAMADMGNSSVTNAFLQGYDFSVAAIIRNSLSHDNTLTNIQSNILAANYNADGVPVNSQFIGCSTIPLATDDTDRALYTAFLAANPTIPTASHWASAGYI